LVSLKPKHEKLILIDNYNQVKGCMSCMEKRLVKAGNAEEFNKQFQDNVDRGVFRKLTRKERSVRK
jgi:hypothetical protein